MFTRRDSEGNFLVLIFCVAGQYGLHHYRLTDNGIYEFVSFTELRGIDTYRPYDTYDIFKRDNSIFCMIGTVLLFMKVLWQSRKNLKKIGLLKN